MDVEKVSLKRDASCLGDACLGGAAACCAPKDAKKTRLPSFEEVTVFSTLTVAQEADRRIDERVRNWLGLGEMLEVPLTVYGPSHFGPASAYRQWLGAAAGDVGARGAAGASAASDFGELQFKMTD